MLIKMRNTVTKVFIFALFGLLILSFAVWGVGDIFLGSGGSTSVAEVGDRVIGQQEFSRDLNREMTRLQQRLGTRLTLEQAAAFGVVEQVVQRLVTGALFDQQASDMGLVVSTDQIKREIADEPGFKDSAGSFDRNRFAQAMRNNGMSEQQFLASLERDIRRRQLTASILGAKTAPRSLAETLHAYRGEQRVANTVRVPLDRAGQPADPDQGTLEAFYEAEQGSFMAPETREVSYLTLGTEDVADEIAVTDEAAREAFEARTDEFVTPERRQVSQLVFSDQAAAQAAHASLGEGRTLEAVAAGSLSGAPVALGLVSRKELEEQLSELADPAFALEAGRTSAPVSSPFGWHLVQVTEIQAGDAPDFEPLRDKVIEALKTERSVEAVISIANQLDDQLAGGATLEEVAAALGLTVHRLPAVNVGGNDSGGKRVEGLPQPTLFLRTLFETEVGEESILLETDAGGFFVLRADGSTPAAVRPLDEVRNEAIALWKTGERRRLVKDLADALAERARTGETLAQVAESEGLTVEAKGPFARFDSNPGAGASRQLIEAMFELDQGAVSAAGDGDGALVLELTEIKPVATGADQDGIDSIKDQLADEFQGDLLAAFSQTLREAHSVTVNRPLIEQMITGVSRY